MSVIMLWEIMPCEHEDSSSGRIADAHLPRLEQLSWRLCCQNNSRWTEHRTQGLFSFSRSSTYRPKGFDVTVKYTQGSWTGFVGEDVVTIPKGFNSSFLVNIATIFESENFFLPGIRWNGILGLAYATLAKVRMIGGSTNIKWWDKVLQPVTGGASRGVQAVQDSQWESHGWKASVHTID